MTNKHWEEVQKIDRKSRKNVEKLVKVVRNNMKKKNVQNHCNMGKNVTKMAINCKKSIKNHKKMSRIE